MSRYNQFTGFAGKLNVKGADTFEGRAVFSAANPIILSWVARCRLQAKQSGLQVVTKHFNTDILRATWTWQFNQEVLNVEVFSTPEVRKIIAEQQEKPTFAEPKENKSEVEPIIEKPRITEIELEEIQIENDLPPIPPQQIMCFVVLYDNTDCVVYDMRSLDKDLATQKPLIKNFTTKGDWTIPLANVIVRRLYDYAGFALNGGSTDDKWNYLQHYCLGMKNTEAMGTCAVATVTFSSGVFSWAGGYGVYRMKAGLKSCRTISAISQIGQVGLNSGFPAMNATDNVLYVNNCIYSLSAEGQLVLEDGDAHGHNTTLNDTYSVPSTPLIPRFIDNSGTAHFDLAWNFALHLPSMGERVLTGLSDPTPNDFDRAKTVSPTSGSTTAAYPVLTQENELDVLRAAILDISREVRETSPLSTNTFYAYGSFPESRGIFPGIFTVPYPPSESEYTIYRSDADTSERNLTSSWLAADRSGWDGRPPFDNPPDAEHTFLGYMQVSNGKHNLQGYALNGNTYDSGKGIWPLEEWFLYLDGSDVTSTMEAMTGTTAQNIQYAFMDVPLYSAQTIKFEPRS